MTGKLIVGSMPLGNLEDITLRMLDAFKNADIILSDYPTTYADQLLEKYEINKNLIILKSFHSCHADREQLDYVISSIRDGLTVLIICSEGQVAVSDPGVQYIQECIRLSLPYVVLPGPNAGIQALVASGLSNGRVFIHPTIEPKNVDTEFPLLKDVQTSLTVYVWGKDIPKILEIIEKDFKWETDQNEQYANKLISFCCDLTLPTEFIVTGWAHEISKHPDLQKITTRTKVTLVMGEMMHMEDCDHHICNSIRSLYPGQKYLGEPQKPVDTTKFYCEHPKDPWTYSN
jgi:16S rRNA C1402 (ribose-2'-O) methylase RsmI